MKKKIMILLLTIVILALLVFNAFKVMYRPVKADSSREIAVSIAEGSSSKEIGDILYNQGLIRSKLAFKLELKSLNMASKLKPGEYILSDSMTPAQIISELVSGPDLDIVKFTIPEGYELKHIASRLSELELVDEKRFLELTSDKLNFQDEFEFLKQLEDGQSLEGFLFPATYEVFKAESEEKIIARMLRAFENIYENDLREKIEQSEYSFNEIITLASIIEREGKLDSERPLMSAVFYNRMDINMRLMSCATVQYIIGERKEHLTNKDTATPSIYNTYLHHGLPPAPIAAPGRASMLAAVEPADVDYLYFTLTGKDGSHTFTKDYADHLKAGEKAKKKDD